MTRLADAGLALLMLPVMVAAMPVWLLTVFVVEGRSGAAQEARIWCGALADCARVAVTGRDVSRATPPRPAPRRSSPSTPPSKPRATR